MTLKDIADRCGVSISAVSYTLRGQPTRFSEATRKRILETAQEMGYDPSRTLSARRLVMSRFGRRVVNHLVALTFPQYFYRVNFYAMVFQGIMDVFSEAGFGVMTIDPWAAEEKMLSPSFDRGEVDGAICMVGWEESQHVLNRLRKNPGFDTRPVVSISAELPGCSSVLIDAEAGARDAAAHLLAQGHRRLLYFRRPGNEPFGTHQDRHLAGYRQACQAQGLNPEEHLIPVDLAPELWNMVFVVGNWQHNLILLNAAKPGYQPLSDAAWDTYRTAIRQQNITAILAPNDAVAIIMRYMLLHDGLRVPEDISLAGFDDTDPLFDDRGENILTTVRLPLYQMGQQAATLLIDRVQGSIPEDKRIILPTELIIRQSTAQRG